jgi:organic radical activating enzyme
MTPKSNNITESKSIKEVLDSKLLREIRETIGAGQEHKFCTSCYEKESKGIQSYRQESNEVFSDTYNNLLSSEGKSLKSDLEYIDLRLGNQCNLACRMCPPNSSANLISDIETLENTKFNDDFHKKTSWFKDQNFWRDLLERSNHVKKIYLAGGEPFLIDETWEFLEALVEKGYSKNITLYYSTNITVLPKKAYKLWPSFKKVQLSLSLDGVEDTYEYIRYPVKWMKIENNLKQLDTDFLKLNIESAVVYLTMQAYNYDCLPALIKKLDSYKNIDKYPIVNILTRPENLSVETLPRDIKTRAVAPLKQLLLEHSTKEYKSSKWKSNFINEVINYIECLKNDSSSKENFEKFKVYTTHFDKTRNQNIFDRIPELKNYFSKN